MSCEGTRREPLRRRRPYRALRARGRKVHTILYRSFIYLFIIEIPIGQIAHRRLFFMFILWSVSEACEFRPLSPKSSGSTATGPEDRFCSPLAEGLSLCIGTAITLTKQCLFRRLSTDGHDGRYGNKVGTYGEWATDDDYFYGYGNSGKSNTDST